jgi:methionyl aminopeptidase
MIRLKTKEDIAILREGGKRHAQIMDLLIARAVEGATSQELEDFTRSEIEKGGDKAAFLGYKPWDAKKPFPAALCLSINDEVVHGIPNAETKVLKEGDTVTLDFGLVHKGLITDMAVTVAIGNVDPISKKLLAVTKDALMAGIKAAKGGKHVGDIGEAVERTVLGGGFTIVSELSGHGVGYEVHEDPYVPNYGEKGAFELLRPGMVLAIEPIVNAGGEKIKLDRDGYTYRTADGSRSAQFEHTVLITDGKAEILTKV